MEIAIIIIFCLGYLLITLEHAVDLSKTATALITGVLCWTVYMMYNDAETVTNQLLEHLGEISGILFFLMVAMTIVELIDSHDGFDLINKSIRTRSLRKLLWIICILTFFLSAILDNLTTTIIMVTLAAKMVRNEKTRLIFVGMIVLTANAGGAWSPMGDVTTTMLWIGGQVSTIPIMTKLIMPSLVNMFVPMVIVTFMISGNLESDDKEKSGEHDVTVSAREQRFVFIAGLTALVSVPIFKTVTHLPPFMGMLLGLGALWLLTELLHKRKAAEQRKQLSVASALERMDVPSVFFFLGILLAVGVLQEVGLLTQLSELLTRSVKQEQLILSIIGVLSAIVDNVPLVAATMRMFSLDMYPMDHTFWILLAYCAGTGGSLLIIGSAAGIAAMGMEKISFGWYVKNITWLAFAGYIAGIGTFLLQEFVLSSFGSGLPGE